MGGGLKLAKSYLPAEGQRLNLFGRDFQVLVRQSPGGIFDPNFELKPVVRINSEDCSEPADGVARESEGRSRLSLLRPVRQDQP